jgi:hypothetical protein
VNVEDIPFEQYVRKSFDVAAIQITDENIAELAPFIVTLEQQENGRYIIIVDRKLIRNLDKVYSGYWLTKMGTTLRCYSQNAFAKHFVSLDAKGGAYGGSDGTSPLVTWNVPTVADTPEDTPLISQDVFE